jgi:hypothetical protein
MIVSVQVVVKWWSSYHVSSDNFQLIEINK